MHNNQNQIKSYFTEMLKNLKINFQREIGMFIIHSFISHSINGESLQIATTIPSIKIN